jgi:two-component system NtrC family sensor kinase
MEVHLCLARLKEAEPRLVKGLTRIEQRARRIEGILRALLGATRPADVSPRPALLNEVVLEAVGLLEAGLESAKIDVHLDMDPRLQPVEMVEAQLTQAVLNILLNAKDAMPEGGRLLVRTRQMEPPEPSRGPLVELRVEDSGPGIAPEHMPRLFEPYFTTKKEGSGLGLYIAKLIVESHEGEIRAESAPGQGAAFIIRLPASGDPSGEAM